MVKSILRKSKIVLESVLNEKDTITFTMNIDANHANNQLDQILQNMENLVNLTNYKVKIDKKDEQPEKPKKKKGFTAYGGSGSYV